MLRATDPGDDHAFLSVVPGSTRQATGSRAPEVMKLSCRTGKESRLRVVSWCGLFGVLALIAPSVQPIQAQRAPVETVSHVASDSRTAAAAPVAKADEDAMPNLWLNPAASDPMVSVRSTATYSVTFQGVWTTTVTPGGVPSGAHFTTLIGGIHNAGVTFLRAGGTASQGVESMAEVGGT